MTDTSDVEQIEADQVEISDLERLMAVDLSTIDPTQKLGVSLCVDPDDFDVGGVLGGVPGQLAALADHAVIYAGAGKRAEALAIVDIDQVGRPGSHVRAIVGSKIVDLEHGSCSWNAKRGEIVVALKAGQIEAKADRTAARNAKRHANRAAASAAQGDPQAVLDAWATVVEPA